MTWQDELQHLDAELAAGRISAEDYRARRDAVLGRGQSGPPAGSTPRQNPFPPAFSWDTTSSGQSSGQQSSGQQSSAHQNPAQQTPAQQTPAQQDSSQPKDASSEESTQVVRNPLVGDQPPNGTETERAQANELDGPTQQVRPVQPNQPVQPNLAAQPNQPARPDWTSHQPAQGQQPVRGPQQGWNAPEGATPWGDSDLPPTPERGGASWPRQGPEVFETAGKSSKRNRIFGLILGSVLVLGVIVAGVFYFTAPGGGSQPQAGPQAKPNAGPQAKPHTGPNAGDTSQQQPLPAPEPAPLAEPPAPAPVPPATSQEVLVAPPPGPPHPFSGVLDQPALTGPKSELLPAEVRDFALQNGAIDGWFNGTDATVPKTTLIAMRMPDQNTASGLMEKYLGGQAGLTPVDELSYKGVKVVSTGTGTLRTGYVTNNWTVIVDVTGQQEADSRALFKTTLDQQLAQSPPTVRG